MFAKTLLILPLVLAPCLAQRSANVSPSQDNTLIEDSTGSLSNAKGPLFAGSTGQGSKRRALLRFDVADALPQKAQIQSAVLKFEIVRSKQSTPLELRLHALLANWGEGSSNSPGGGGAPASTNDATWLHRFWPGTKWQNAGGDFGPRVLGTKVGGLGTYRFGSNTALVQLVQSWVDDPRSNFGVILLGDETNNDTSKQIASREYSIQSQRPVLQLTYTVQAWTAPIGQGCAVSSGSFTHDANGLPQLGNANYRLEASAGPARAAGVLLLGLAALPQPAMLNASCFLYVDPAQLVLIGSAPLDAQGKIAFPLPIPNTQSLMGTELQSQIVSVDLGWNFGSTNLLVSGLGL